MPFDDKNIILNTKNISKNLTKVADMANDQIIKSAKAYVEADVHVTPGANTYTLTKHEGVFARVAVGTGEGGYALVLKKVYDLWVVVASGQDIPSKATGEKYGLPSGWYSLEY